MEHSPKAGAIIMKETAVHIPSVMRSSLPHSCLGEAELRLKESQRFWCSQLHTTSWDSVRRGMFFTSRFISNHDLPSFCDKYSFAAPVRARPCFCGRAWNGVRPGPTIACVGRRPWWPHSRAETQLGRCRRKVFIRLRIGIEWHLVLAQLFYYSTTDIFNVI